MNRLNSKKIIILCILFSVCSSIIIAFAFFLKKQVENQYDYAVQLMKEQSIESYSKAIECFIELGDYKDSLIQLGEAQKYVENYTENEKKYEDAKIKYQSGQFLSALEIFRSLDDFKDSREWSNIVLYEYALQLYKNGEYTEASQYFLELGNYEDSEMYAARAIVKITENMQEIVYNEATKYFFEGRYLDAIDRFEDISGYKDSVEWIEKCKTAYKMRQMATTIDAGIRKSTAIQSDGLVVSTLNDSKIQEEISQWEDVVSISAFGELTIGLKEDGTVVTAGTYDDGKVPDVSQWEDIIQIATGQQFVVGLKSDGTVVGAGHGDDGQLDFKKWENIVYIATGWRHTVGLDSEGNIFVVGYRAQSYIDEITKINEIAENNKDVKGWTNIIAIATGGGYGSSSGNGHIVGLRDDGYVVAVGDKQCGQCDVKNWEGIVAIAAGDWHTVGLTNEGRVVAVGWLEEEEELLINDASSVEEWEEIVAIAAGRGYTIGLTRDGEIVSVGYNTEGARTKMDSWKKEVKVYNEWESVAIYDKRNDSEVASKGGK